MADITVADLFPNAVAATSTGADTLVGIVDATDYVAIPISDLHGLTQTELLTDDDARKVVFGFVETAFAALDAMDAADKPVSLSISRGSPSGAGDSAYRTYAVKFLTDQSNIDLVDEA